MTGHPKGDDISEGPFVRARIVNRHENTAKKPRFTKFYLAAHEASKKWRETSN